MGSGLPLGEAGSRRGADGRLMRVTLAKQQRHSPPLRGPSPASGGGRKNALHPQDFSGEHRDKIPRPRLPIRFTVGTGRGPIPASGGRTASEANGGKGLKDML